MSGDESRPVVSVKKLRHFADVLTGKPRRVFVVDCPQCGAEHEVAWLHEGGRCTSEPFTRFDVVKGGPCP